MVEEDSPIQSHLLLEVSLLLESPANLIVVRLNLSEASLELDAFLAIGDLLGWREGCVSMTLGETGE